MKRNLSRRGKPADAVHSVEVYKLKKPRKGAIIKIETWATSDGRVFNYSLSYINPMITSVDNGRVLAYDNAHGYSHRHFRGEVQAVEFSSFEELTERFFNEVYALWDQENG